jgi:zinc/manganese transport system permease protein
MAIIASVGGLLGAYWLDLPAGPAIVLTAGALWACSLVAGPKESLVQGWLRRPHLTG